MFASSSIPSSTSPLVLLEEAKSPVESVPRGPLTEADQARLFNAVCAGVFDRRSTLGRGQIFTPRLPIPVPPLTREEWRIRLAIESCPFKSALSCVAGAVVGVGLGLVTAAFDPMHTFIGNQTPTVRLVLLEMKSRCGSYAKNFALIGAAFSGIECLVESYRAKDDWTNSPMAGTITGGLIGLRTGIPGAIVGGVGFGLFSLVIDYFVKW